jgi:hypothetical protein
MSGIFSQGQFVKSPVNSISELPVGDMIGTLRVVTSLNQIYIQNSAGWNPVQQGDSPSWITSLTGDVITGGILKEGVASTTVVQVAGVKSADIANTCLKVQSAVPNDAPNTLVLRSGKGEFSATRFTSSYALISNLSTVYMVARDTATDVLTVNELLKATHITSGSLESDTIVTNNSIETKSITVNNTMRGNYLEAQSIVSNRMTLNTAPSADLDVTNKKYVDEAVRNATNYSTGNVVSYGQSSKQSISSNAYVPIVFPLMQQDLWAGDAGVISDGTPSCYFINHTGRNIVICVTYSVVTDFSVGFKSTQIVVTNPISSFNLAYSVISTARDTTGQLQGQTGAATFKLGPKSSFQIILYQSSGVKINTFPSCTNVQVVRIN